MDKTSVPILGAIVAALLSLLVAPAAFAQPATPQAVDCAKARNPERCEARQKARGACGDLRGPERRQSGREHLPPTDCSKAANPTRCTAMQAAHEACKAQVGAARRQCLHEHAPGPGTPAPSKP